MNVNLFAVDFNVRDIILENGGDVHFWELIFAEDYQKTSLTTGPVAHYYQLFTN
jgi:hypothetical protein